MGYMNKYQSDLVNAVFLRHYGSCGMHRLFAMASDVHTVCGGRIRDDPSIVLDWFEKARRCGLRWHGEADDAVPFDPPVSYDNEWHRNLRKKILKYCQGLEITVNPQFLQWHHYVAEDMRLHGVSDADVLRWIHLYVPILSHQGRFAVPTTTTTNNRLLFEVSDDEMDAIIDDGDPFQQG